MIRRNLDNNTHLEYSQYSKRKMDWDRAWLYCATYTYKDKYNWRLLTVDEFRSDPDVYGWYGTPDLRWRSHDDKFPAFALPVRDRGPAVT